MRDANEESLNTHMREIDYRERMTENFTDDIEPIIDEISDLICKIKNIAEGYEDFDFKDEIKTQINDLL